MKSVKANHLTGKVSLNVGLIVLLFFPSVADAKCRDTNWCINTPGKHILEKRTDKVVVYGRLGWCPTSGTRVLAHQKSTSALQAWSQWSLALQEWWCSPSQAWNHHFHHFALEEVYELEWSLLSVRLLKHGEMRASGITRETAQIMIWSVSWFTPN